MTVTIRVETLSGASCEVQLEEAAKVWQAKQEIERLLGLPAVEQRLILGSTVLDNELEPFGEAGGAGEVVVLQVVRVPQVSLWSFAAAHEIDLTTQSGLETALRKAASLGEDNVCLQAIHHEALLRPNWTQLLCLTQAGLAAAFEALLEHPDFGQAEDASSQACYVLQLASRSGLLLQCKALLESRHFSAAAGRLGPSIGSYPLHHAANEAVLRALLSCEALAQAECINARDRFGCTCLHYASNEGMCRAILSQPEFSSVNVADAEGQTALHWARNAGVSAAILEYPGFSAAGLRDGAGRTALHLLAATADGAVPLLEAMARARARSSVEDDPSWPLVDVDAADSRGRTALHSASSGKVCEALFRAGFSNVNAIDNSGRTALHIARNADVARAILAHPDFTQVNARDESDETALAMAVRRMMHEVVAAIAETGRAEEEEAWPELEGQAWQALAMPDVERRGCWKALWCSAVA